ncbi:MAG: 4-(cytidine 5'-diphospho)-2-C-methyl-D-erythritol kinase, partial [Clostridia bacterium]|nr:4-(cytidine 5'-diphospho)-2-C-methyl-D-erythritol kinase [Clostridia bacterium]
MILQAAAKINLMLDILGTTEDGYHTLFMIMQSMGLYDTVTITETGTPDTITLSCSNEALPSDETNIGWKAASRFFAETGVPNPGIHID